MKRVKTQEFYRSAEVVPESFDGTSRSVEVIFSTGARVLRRPFFDDPFIEELSLEPSHVRLNRLNNGAPFLNNHSNRNLNDVLGVVESAKVNGKQGTAKVRFSNRGDVRPILDDISNGIIRKVSVGYTVHKFEEKEKENDMRVLRAIDWEPMELSAVAIGADDGAMVRNGETKEYDCQLLLRNEERNKDMKMQIEKEGPSADVASKLKDENKKESEIVDSESIRKEATSAERRRYCEIRKAVSAANLGETFAEDLIERGVSVSEARKIIINHLAENDTVETRNMRVEMGGINERDTRIAGAEIALLHRFDPQRYQLNETAKEYRFLSLIDLARELVEAKGIRSRGLSKMEIAHRALLSTDDFPLLLANVANKTLRDAYEAAPQTFMPFVRPVTVSDFKPISRVQLGDAPSLEKVNEGGEVRRGAIGEAGESYKVETYGKIMAITRQTLVNDDLDAFTRLPELFGRAARDLESDLVWGLIIANARMADGQNLFSAAHKNLKNPGGIISVDAIGEARAAMRVQTGLNGRLLNLKPNRLVVPAALETVAEKFVAQNISASKSEDVNPFIGKMQVIAEPRLDAHSVKVWYTFADRMQIDMVDLARLEGTNGPVIETKQGFDVEGIEIKARMDVGAKVIDHRGFYKNNGGN